METRRGKGEASGLLKFSLDFVVENNLFQYIWTYTPDNGPLKEWHKARGAKNSGVILENARLGYMYPNVCLMDYSSLRKRA